MWKRNTADPSFLLISPPIHSFRSTVRGRKPVMNRVLPASQLPMLPDRELSLQKGRPAGRLPLHLPIPSLIFQIRCYSPAHLSRRTAAGWSVQGVGTSLQSLQGIYRLVLPGGYSFVLPSWPTVHSTPRMGRRFDCPTINHTSKSFPFVLIPLFSTQHCA